MTEPISQEFDFLSNADLPQEVREVYQLLKRYKEDKRRKWWLEQRDKCWKAAFENEIWDDEDKRAMKLKDMVPLAINDLIKGIQGAAAVVTDQKPGVNFLPKGSGDLYDAELMKRGFDVVWDQNEGSEIVYDMVEESKTGGMGSIDVKFDNAKGPMGKCIIDELDPENLYWDMDSRKRDLSDVHFMKAVQITKTEAKDEFGLTDEEINFVPGVEKEETGDKVDTKIGEDNYVYPEKPHTTVPDVYAEPKNVWKIEAWLIKKTREFRVSDPQTLEHAMVKSEAEAKELKAQYEGQGRTAIVRDVVSEKRLQRIVVGKKLVSKMENPHGIDSDGEPVIPVISLRHNRTKDGKPVSPTFFALEVCRERNKRRMQAIYVVSKEIDAPLVMPEGAEWVKDEKHGDYIKIAKLTAVAPQRITAQVTSGEMLRLEQTAKEDINDIYDKPDVMSGKIPAGQNQIAARTVLALQDMAGMMSKPFVRAVESALVRLGKVVIAIILRHWTRDQWERLIEPDEWNEWQPEGEQQTDEMGNPIQPPAEMINKKWMAALDRICPRDPSAEPAIRMIDIDVKVSAGSTMPTNRMAKQSVAMELVKAGIYDAQAALDYVDDPKKDQIVKRMQQKEQQMIQMGIQKQGGK